MKLIRTQTGGYPRTMDPILSLQAEMIAGLNAQFANLGKDMVLQGCTVTDNKNGTVNIASGIMYVAGQVIRFDGANNVAANGSQAIVVGSTVDSQPPVVFGNQSAYSLYTEQKAIIVAQDPLNRVQMKVTTSLYSFQQYLADQVNTSVITQINNSVSTIVANSVQSLINASYPKGSIKEIYDLSPDKSFLTNFDSTGLGISSPWIGWALDNGYQGRTPGSAGRTTVGVGQYNDDTGSLNLASGDIIGKVKHRLTTSEMPAHTHDQQADAYNTTGSGSSKAAGKDGNGSRGTTLSTGGGDTHNNMQPSIGVYRVVKIAD